LKMKNQILVLKNSFKKLKVSGKTKRLIQLKRLIFS